MNSRIRRISTAAVFLRKASPPYSHLLSSALHMPAQKIGIDHSAARVHAAAVL